MILDGKSEEKRSFGIPRRGWEDNIRIVSTQLVKPKRGWAERIACIREVRNAYRIFVVKPEGKRPQQKSRRRWKDNIKMDVREIGWEVWTEYILLWIGSSGGLL
jgi:hypothetical protein